MLFLWCVQQVLHIWLDLSWPPKVLLQFPDFSYKCMNQKGSFYKKSCTDCGEYDVSGEACCSCERPTQNLMVKSPCVVWTHLLKSQSSIAKQAY